MKYSELTTTQQLIIEHTAKGNKKLPKSTIIYNLSSATDCPCKAFCPHYIDGSCYALKAEKQYNKTCPQYRTRQNKLWYETASAYDYITAYSYMIAQSIKNKKSTEITALRINEAGDIRNENDLIRLFIIARELKARFNGFKVYMYTHNLPVLDKMKLSQLDTINSMVTINISLDYHTEDNSRYSNFNRFLVVNELDKTGIQCIGNCRLCSLCTVNHGKVTQVKKH